MNKKKLYKGFTLVELLIVMGIIAVLAVLGVAVARFAIQRANNIQHSDAVDELGNAMQLYYGDKREYPTVAEFTDFETALGASGVMGQYIDTFDAGGTATYYYFVTSDQQKYLLCVSYGGSDDVGNQGGGCSGNGFGDLPTTTTPASNKEMDATVFESIVVNQATSGVSQDWDTANGWQ
ncbi:type II secretion system protein [Candidatus Nomurabacteria bacterium]|nr:type II secretion system protein [Candidatus Nomurabacteria bacterium]